MALLPDGLTTLLRAPRIKKGKEASRRAQRKQLLQQKKQTLAGAGVDAVAEDGIAESLSYLRTRLTRKRRLREWEGGDDSSTSGAETGSSKTPFAAGTISTALPSLADLAVDKLLRAQPPSKRKKERRATGHGNVETTYAATRRGRPIQCFAASKLEASTSSMPALAMTDASISRPCNDKSAHKKEKGTAEVVSAKRKHKQKHNSPPSESLTFGKSCNPTNETQTSGVDVQSPGPLLEDPAASAVPETLSLSNAFIHANPPSCDKANRHWPGCHKIEGSKRHARYFDMVERPPSSSVTEATGPVNSTPIPRDSHGSQDNVHLLNRPHSKSKATSSSSSQNPSSSKISNLIAPQNQLPLIKRRGKKIFMKEVTLPDGRSVIRQKTKCRSRQKNLRKDGRHNSVRLEQEMTAN